MITIAYINFWTDPRNDRWLSDFISKTIAPVEHVSIHDNPDILIGSCFGPLNNSIKSVNAKCKIFFTGENPERYKPYDDFDLVREYYNLIVGFRPSLGDDNVVRFPHWLIYSSSCNIDDENNIVDDVEKSHEVNKHTDKQWFATMVARAHHSDKKISRHIVYNEVAKHGKIMAPAGLVNGNTSRIGSSYKDKLQFITKGKYHICPENSSYPGYCTEKIFHAAQAGTIPIYWGHELPETGIINSNKYCFADISNKQEMQRNIVDCIGNPSKYIDGPFFTSDAKTHIQSMYTNLTNKIEKLLNN